MRLDGWGREGCLGLFVVSLVWPFVHKEHLSHFINYYFDYDPYYRSHDLSLGVQFKIVELLIGSSLFQIFKIDCIPFN
jgi:hypothetical protein